MQRSWMLVVIFLLCGAASCRFWQKKEEVPAPTQAPVEAPVSPAPSPPSVEPRPVEERKVDEISPPRPRVVRDTSDPRYQRIEMLRKQLALLREELTALNAEIAETEAEFEATPIMREMRANERTIEEELDDAEHDLSRIGRLFSEDEQ